MEQKVCKPIILHCYQTNNVKALKRTQYPAYNQEKSPNDLITSFNWKQLPIEGDVELPRCQLPANNTFHSSTIPQWETLQHSSMTLVTFTVTSSQNSHIVCLIRRTECFNSPSLLEVWRQSYVYAKYILEMIPKNVRFYNSHKHMPV